MNATIFTAVWRVVSQVEHLLYMRKILMSDIEHIDGPTDVADHFDAADYPVVEELEFVGETIVDTDRPERYAKQLVSHFGRKIPTAEVAHGHRLTFNRDGNFSGYADILVEPIDGVENLKLVIYAADAEKREKLAGVVGRHLERFGERDQLEVHWEF